MQWIQSGCMLNPVLRPHQLWLMWSDCLHWAEPSSSSSWRQLTQGRAEHRHWSLLHWRNLKTGRFSGTFWMVIILSPLSGLMGVCSRWTSVITISGSESDPHQDKWISRSLVPHVVWRLQLHHSRRMCSAMWPLVSVQVCLLQVCLQGGYTEECVFQPFSSGIYMWSCQEWDKDRALVSQTIWPKRVQTDQSHPTTLQK